MPIQEKDTRPVRSSPADAERLIVRQAESSGLDTGKGEF